jgi:hypothetical protein
MGDKVTFSEMWFQLYRTYDDYHSKKETLLWTTVSTYITFVGLMVGLIFSNLDKLTVFLKWWLFGLAASIWILATIFAWYQNFYKANAVRITSKLYDVLKETGSKIELTPEELIRKTVGSSGCCWRQKLRTIWDCGKAGLVLIVLMFSLGIAQLVLIGSIPSIWEPRKTSYFYTFPSCQVGEAVIYS